MVQHHNRAARSLGTQLASQSFRQRRASSAFGKRRTLTDRKKAWTPFFLLKLALQRLSTTTKNTMRESSRSLDAAAGVVSAALHHQTAALSSWKYSLSCSVLKAPWIWLSVAWDETPMNLVLGGLAGSLRPIARYWWRESTSGPWHLLSQDECTQRGISRHSLSGVVETMGMDASLTWTSWDSVGKRDECLSINSEKLLMPQRFLPSSAAGHVSQGLDDTLSGVFLA